MKEEALRRYKEKQKSKIDPGEFEREKSLEIELEKQRKQNEEIGGSGDGPKSHDHKSDDSNDDVGRMSAFSDLSDARPASHESNSKTPGRQSLSPSEGHELPVDENQVNANALHVPASGSKPNGSANLRDDNKGRLEPALWLIS